MLRSPLALVLIALLGACTSGSDGAGAQKGGGTGTDWDAFVSRYIEADFRADPLFAVYQGRHEYDGRFPDWSTEALGRRIAGLHRWRDTAAAFTLEAGDSARRFERDYVVGRIDRDLFWLERAEWPWRNPEYYFDGIEPNVYLARDYAPLPERMRAFTNWASNLPGGLRQMQANIRTPMPAAYAQIGGGRAAGLADFIERNVPAIFASVADSALHHDFAEASRAAVRALRESAGWFRDQERKGNQGYALGGELFRDMVRMTEAVDVSLDTLEAWGRADLDRNLAALREACGRYAPGRPIPECVARGNARKPAGGPVRAARAQLDTLEGFLRAQDLVSIPGTERAMVEEAPPYRRFNAAYIDIPGPYEKGLPSIYYIASPDPSWSRAERDAYIPGTADLLFVSVHEVWPGHFLQFLHANRAASRFGQVFVGYAYAEGWAHYAEQMMWDAGLGGGSPAVHIGQLRNALLRNVRYLSAIGLHTKGMTIAESERMFREQAFQDPGNARQQASRGTYDPAYLNYTLGKLVIMRLRDDWTAGRGGRGAWKQFHDQFLSYGGPPVGLVRRAMMGHD